MEKLNDFKKGQWLVITWNYDGDKDFVKFEAPDDDIPTRFKYSEFHRVLVNGKLCMTCETDTRNAGLDYEDTRRTLTVATSEDLKLLNTALPIEKRVSEQINKDMNPVFYKGPEEMDKPMGQLIHELRSELVKTRGKLHDIKRSFGWEDWIINYEGGLTCIIAAMSHFEKELDRFETQKSNK